MTQPVSLKPFHQLPPRKMTIELTHDCHEMLKDYAAYYNRLYDADVKESEVAAAIIEQFLQRDRTFKKYLRSKRDDSLSASNSTAEMAEDPAGESQIKSSDHPS